MPYPYPESYLRTAGELSFTQRLAIGIPLPENFSFYLMMSMFILLIAFVAMVLIHGSAYDDLRNRYPRLPCGRDLSRTQDFDSSVDRMLAIGFFILLISMVFFASIITYFSNGMFTVYSVLLIYLIPLMAWFMVRLVFYISLGLLDSAIQPILRVLEDQEKCEKQQAIVAEQDSQKQQRASTADQESCERQTASTAQFDSSAFPTS